MNTNLCNNTYLFSPPTAAALEQCISFQILYHCIIVSLYHCIFAPSFITNIVISYFSFDKLFLIWQYQEYFTLTCKNTFRGQSRKQACLWLPLDGFLWNSTKCQQHNCELSWNISIYLSIYHILSPGGGRLFHALLTVPSAAECLKPADSPQSASKLSRSKVMRLKTL